MSTIKCALLAAAMAVSSACGAQAAVLTLGVNGVFDGTGDMGPTSNAAAGLVGAAYSMSWTIGTDASTLIRTEVDPTDPSVKAWFFNTSSSFQGPAGGYASATGGVVVSVTNDFVYDGSQGLVAAGTYDILNLTGWRFAPGPGHALIDPVACGSGGPLLGDGGNPCAIFGLQMATELTLIADSGFFTSLAGIPFGALDFSHVRYGLTGLDIFVNGVQTGEVVQDPPLSFINGQLVGENMTVDAVVTAVPEPTTWAMLILGFGMIGAALRGRPRVQPAYRAFCG